MKWKWVCPAVLALALLFPLGTFASAGAPEYELQAPGAEEFDDAFDIESQLDALGKDELMREVPEGARELLEQADIYDLSVASLLQLSPRDFFRTVWEVLVQQVKKPLRTLGVIVAVVILCAVLGGLRTAVGESALSQMFTMVAALCVLTSVIMPILDCIVNTSAAVQDTAMFMLTFIPVFSASLIAAGQPVTGATYNLFLFSTCQAVAQIVAKTLIPLMGVYLALCVAGALVSGIKISSATATIKKIITWTLGLVVTVFVGLLSIQSMLSGSADGVATKTAKFLIGSFVPVVGGALSEAYSAAQGCLRLIKTSVGAYGIIVALFTFLPVLLQTVAWYLVTNVAAIAGDILGVETVSEILKSCASVLGILIAVILCFALLIIVSTAVVMLTGLGAA